MRKNFKKVVLPVFFGAVSFYISFIFALGTILGFIFGKYTSGKEAGQSGRLKSARFSVGKYIIHLHHWLYASLGLVIVFIGGMTYFFPIFVLGFGAGFAFQGIYCYDDWHRFVIKRKN